jgi:adenosylmethionine-8-amino-7-oxononanoate aminotransferase
MIEASMQSSLSERDKRVIWHPYTPQKYMPEPIPIVKGEGVVLTDANGQSYIDAISSWWVTLHGHGHPYIAQKMYEQALQLEQVIFAGFTHEPAVRLAERLLEILPGPCSKIFYSDDGSTATEVAVKMALQYWWNKGEKKRTKVLAFTGGYHGDTFGAMSVSDRSVFTLAFREKLFDVIFIAPPGNIDVEKWEQELSALPWSEIACFIYEPMIQGAGGMNIYPAEGLDMLLKICHEHQAICIADEVMTGFGRTGKMFASEYMQEQPDIVCLSKGLTGGTMALGVTACNEKIYEAFYEEDKLKTFFHGHSFTANPLACAAALASLDLLQQSTCYWQTKMISAGNAEFLNGGLRENKKVKNIRRLGTILAFEIDTGNDGYLNNISREITSMAMKKGVYLRPLGNTVYMMPPYCITQEQLAKLYTVLLEIVSGFD